MRIAVLVLAAVGGLASGTLGMMWAGDASKAREFVREVEKLGVAPGAVREVVRVERAGYLLVVSMLAALGAAVTAYLGREKVAGSVLLAAAVVPVLFAAKALVATALLLAAGALCFVPKTRPGAREQAGTLLRRAA